MSIIMKDQANKDWLAPEKPLWTTKQEQEIECIAFMPVAIISIIAVVAILVMAFNAPKAFADITGATTDALMSEDMASYIAIYGHAAIFEEGDMQ